MKRKKTDISEMSDRDERLQEVGEAYSEDQFVDCGLIFCVTCGKYTCGKYTCEEELEAHKGHDLARRPGEITTKKVLRRMRGNGET